MFSSAVKLSGLGDDIDDLASQEKTRPQPAVIVSELAAAQLQTFRDQLAALVQLQQDYIDDGGRPFVCDLIQRQPEDAPASVRVTDDPLSFAEALYDILDHRGRVKLGMMQVFVELCEKTAEIHQRAVLLAAVENFTSEDFRLFVKAAEGESGVPLTQGLAVFKTWAVAATQPPIPPKTVYTRREQDWCLQIAAHLLALLSRRLSSHEGGARTTTAAFESDKAFWRGLLPGDAKNNPLVKLVKTIGKKFKKGLYGVGGVGGGRKKTLPEAFPTYGFQQHLDKLKEAVKALLVEPTAAEAAAGAAAGVAASRAAAGRGQAGKSGPSRLKKKFDRMPAATPPAMPSKRKGATLAPLPADVAAPGPKIVRKEPPRKFSATAAAAATNTLSASVVDGVDAAARGKPSAVTSSGQRGPGRAFGTAAKGSVAPCRAVEGARTSGTSAQGPGPAPHRPSDQHPPMLSSAPDAGNKGRAAPRAVQPVQALPPMPSAAPAQETKQRVQKLKWADSVVESGKQSSLLEEIPFFKMEPPSLLRHSAAAANVSGVTDSRPWLVPQLLTGISESTVAALQNAFDESRRLDSQTGPGAVPPALVKSDLTTTTKVKRPLIGPTDATACSTVILPKRSYSAGLGAPAASLEQHVAFAVAPGARAAAGAGLAHGVDGGGTALSPMLGAPAAGQAGPGTHDALGFAASPRTPTETRAGVPRDESFAAQRAFGISASAPGYDRKSPTGFASTPAPRDTTHDGTGAGRLPTPGSTHSPGEWDGAGRSSLNGTAGGATAALGSNGPAATIGTGGGDSDGCIVVGGGGGSAMSSTGSAVVRRLTPQSETDSITVTIKNTSKTASKYAFLASQLRQILRNTSDSDVRLSSIPRLYQARFGRSIPTGTGTLKEVLKKVHSVDVFTRGNPTDFFVRLREGSSPSSARPPSRPGLEQLKNLRSLIYAAGVEGISLIGFKDKYEKKFGTELKREPGEKLSVLLLKVHGAELFHPIPGKSPMSVRAGATSGNRLSVVRRAGSDRSRGGSYFGSRGRSSFVGGRGDRNGRSARDGRNGSNSGRGRGSSSSRNSRGGRESSVGSSRSTTSTRGGGSSWTCGARGTRSSGQGGSHGNWDCVSDGGGGSGGGGGGGGGSYNR